jgi:hypothetical protein
MLCRLRKNRGECVEVVTSLGYVAVRATVNFEIVFYVLLCKYRPETSRIIFYGLLVFCWKYVIIHMRVFS